MGIVAFGLIMWGGQDWIFWAGITLGLVSIYPLFMGCLMLFDSLHTKVRHADELLSLIPWTGGGTGSGRWLWAGPDAGQGGGAADDWSGHRG